ncbi:GntR family transcriptional regulator [Denitrobaculum tricleocarpae]|nr:GntR family transcriptional regulator [Denitrobaculum tricleocarpae]
MQHPLPENAVIDPRQSRSSQVYAILRSAIIDLTLPPTMVIKKEEIAAQLGISRTPISEAINRLAEEGLVEIFPQHGTYVSKIRTGDVLEGAFLRRALEVETVREVALRITREVLNDLDRNVRYQKANLEADDLDAFHRLDIEFHQMICDFLGFTKVRRAIDSSRAQLDRVRKMMLTVVDRPIETYHEHLAIVDALRKGSPDAAGEAMTRHLAAGIAPLQKRMKERPELFE